MEQRRLRLGDILDDYCPRERRVTNHAIVAMVDDDVKQTRCTTCDAEHVYKGGQEPRRRRKDTTAVLYREVLAGMTENDAAPAEPAIPPPVIVPLPTESAYEESDRHAAESPAASTGATAPADQPEAVQVDERETEGPIHRRLIRATLPRPEGQKDVRTAPDFTIRGNGQRSHGQAGFRGDRTRGHGSGHGLRGGRRFPGGHGGHGGPGGGRGGRSNFGGGNGRQGGGRKRSR